MGKHRKIEDPKLEAKAERIFELHKQSEDFTKRSDEAAKEAVLRAWEAGKILLEVKESLRHGKYMSWLKKELPEISRATVYRYRKIAEFFETPEEVATAFEKHGCLKGLYKAAGAIGSEGDAKKDAPAEQEQETDPEPAEPSPIVRLQRSLHRLRQVEHEVEKLAGEVPLEQWTTNEKFQLISTTKALLRIIEDRGWWEGGSAGDRSVNGKEVPDAA